MRPKSQGRMERLGEATRLRLGYVVACIEHVAIGNGAFGGSDIEGKAAMGSGE